jgi:hypothetical protein
MGMRQLKIMPRQQPAGLCRPRTKSGQISSRNGLQQGVNPLLIAIKRYPGFLDSLFEVSGLYQSWAQNPFISIP